MKRRIAVATAITALSLYLAVYLALSAAGDYRVGGWGLRGPTGPRIWAPRTFYNRYNEVNMLVAYFYIPLFLLDRSIWHKDTWSPPLPPPFVQGDLVINGPIQFHRPVKLEKEGAVTYLSTSFTDARGRRFSIRMSRSTSGRVPRSPIYIEPDGNGSNVITVENQAIFFSRVLEHVKEEPEQ